MRFLDRRSAIFVLPSILAIPIDDLQVEISDIKGRGNGDICNSEANVTEIERSFSTLDEVQSYAKTLTKGCKFGSQLTISSKAPFDPVPAVYNGTNLTVAAFILSQDLLKPLNEDDSPFGFARLKLNVAYKEEDNPFPPTAQAGRRSEVPCLSKLQLWSVAFTGSGLDDPNNQVLKLESREGDVLLIENYTEIASANTLYFPMSFIDLRLPANLSSEHQVDGDRVIFVKPHSLLACKVDGSITLDGLMATHRWVDESKSEIFDVYSLLPDSLMLSTVFGPEGNCSTSPEAAALDFAILQGEEGSFFEEVALRLIDQGCHFAVQYSLQRLSVAPVRAVKDGSLIYTHAMVLERAYLNGPLGERLKFRDLQLDFFDFEHEHRCGQGKARAMAFNRSSLFDEFGAIDLDKVHVGDLDVDLAWSEEAQTYSSPAGGERPSKLSDFLDLSVQDPQDVLIYFEPQSLHCSEQQMSSAQIRLYAQTENLKKPSRRSQSEVDRDDADNAFPFAAYNSGFSPTEWEWVIWIDGVHGCQYTPSACLKESFSEKSSFVACVNEVSGGADACEFSLNVMFRPASEVQPLQVEFPGEGRQVSVPAVGLTYMPHSVWGEPVRVLYVKIPGAYEDRDKCKDIHLRSALFTPAVGLDVLYNTMPLTLLSPIYMSTVEIAEGDVPERARLNVQGGPRGSIQSSQIAILPKNGSTCKWTNRIKPEIYGVSTIVVNQASQKLSSKLLSFNLVLLLWVCEGVTKVL